MSNLFVLVELGATEKSPGRSPTKIYTPLEVIPPGQPTVPSPTANPEHISVITIGSSTIASDSAAVESEEPQGETVVDTVEDTIDPDGIVHSPAQVNFDLLDSTINPEDLETSKEEDTPHLASIHENLVEPLLSGVNALTMDTSPEVITAPNVGTSVPLPKQQASTSLFTQFLLPSPTARVEQLDLDPEKHNSSLNKSNDKADEVPTDFETTEVHRPNVQSVNITRNELVAITNVIEKLPQSYIGGTETENDQGISFSVVEDTLQEPPRGNPEEDQHATNSGPNISHSEQELDEPPVICNKRPMPRYSLKGSMLRKHPVLKFSATGPVNRDKTPYKWSCRVCRIELSLMSRGVLELMAHYKTESHLVREHRIRMETPGMALYDKDECELQGLALAGAKKIARDTYPIALQLDCYRLLVGQDSLPHFGTDKSPTETVSSQICIIEIGLRRGGDISCVTDIYDEINRFSSGEGQAITFNWSPYRIFVSDLNFHQSHNTTSGI